MMGLKETFTTKIGPLPTIAWAGLAGGAYYLYASRKAKNAAVTTTSQTGTSADPFNTGQGSSLGDAMNNPGYSDAASAFMGGGSSAVSTPGNATPTIDSNTTWGKMAADYLVSLGVDPADAQTSISSYLYGTGQALNPTQAAALNNALRKFGSPPGGVIAPPAVTSNPVIPNTPTPVATPTPVKTTTPADPLAAYEGKFVDANGDYFAIYAPGTFGNSGRTIINENAQQVASHGQHVQITDPAAVAALQQYVGHLG